MKQVLKQRDDIAFYLIMYPLTSIHDDSYRKSKSILCAKDNAERLKRLELAYDKKPVPDPECETDAVDVNMKSASDNGVFSTPTVFSGDGRRLNVQLTPESIISEITQGK